MNEMLVVWLIGLFLGFGFGFGSGIILGCRFGFRRGEEATEKRWAAFTGRRHTDQRWNDTVRRAADRQGKS